MNRIQRNVLHGILIAAAFVMLAGCGNKGPLYLPPPPEPIEPATVPADQPPADADSTEPPAEPAAEPAQPTEESDTEKPADPPPEVPASDANG